MHQGDQGSRGTLHKTGLYFMGICALICYPLDEVMLWGTCPLSVEVRDVLRASLLIANKFSDQFCYLFFTFVSMRFLDDSEQRLRVMLLRL